MDNGRIWQRGLPIGQRVSVFIIVGRSQQINSGWVIVSVVQDDMGVPIPSPVSLVVTSTNLISGLNQCKEGIAALQIGSRR